MASHARRKKTANATVQIFTPASVTIPATGLPDQCMHLNIYILSIHAYFSCFISRPVCIALHAHQSLS